MTNRSKKLINYQGKKINQEILWLQRDSSLNAIQLPNISLDTYLLIILSNSPISRNTFIGALIYTDRFFSTGVSPTEYNIHRVILVSVLLASKFLEDKSPSNHFFSRVGGIDVWELNFIEAEFLDRIGYDLFIEESFFQEYSSAMKIEKKKK